MDKIIEYNTTEQNKTAQNKDLSQKLKIILLHQ